MILTNKKSVIEKFESEFKLERLIQFRRIVYYLTNYKDTEISVSRMVIESMKNEGLIDENDCYKQK